MSVVLRIAWRYFFSKSSQTVINRINSIALVVIVVATASLMIVLSAFSGLKAFGLSFSNVFDPDYRILPAQGKAIFTDSLSLNLLKEIEGVEAVSPILEEKVFLSFDDKSQVAYLKGVLPDYLSVVPADSLVVVGEWLIPDSSGIVTGYGIASAMGLGVYDYSSFLNISIPKKTSQKNFRQNPFYAQKAVTVGLYQISEDIDKKYVFSNMSFARSLFQYPLDTYSAIEIKTKQNVSSKNLIQKAYKIFGENIVIKDRIQLNTALYKMLNTENIAVYLIFTLVLIIALFNVVGALVMMILDKKPQMKILTAMGTPSNSLRKIFFLLGMLISFFGGGLGIIIASAAIIIQQNYPFLYVPGTSLPYPVRWEFENFLLVFFTLAILGAIASGWASRGVKK